MTLAALLGGVILLGGIATLLWAYSLSVSTAGTNSDQYRFITSTPPAVLVVVVASSASASSVTAEKYTPWSTRTNGDLISVGTRSVSPSTRITSSSEK